ncbi:MAG: PIN domain-containing protein [Treponema sp.]|nr:PIN domain-containing protein [Treponema sp.]
MKVLVDTNVFLDCLLKRQNLYEGSKQVIQYCLFSVQGFIAAHSFSDMFYVLHETEKRSLDYCRSTILKLCQTFEVCTIDKQRIMNAAQNLNFEDFEDALQNECAYYSGVDYIITRNASDFENASAPVISPEDFVTLMSETD